LNGTNVGPVLIYVMTISNQKTGKLTEDYLEANFLSLILKHFGYLEMFTLDNSKKFDGLGRDFLLKGCISGMEMIVDCKGTPDIYLFDIIYEHPGGYKWKKFNRPFGAKCLTTHYFIKPVINETGEWYGTERFITKEERFSEVLNISFDEFDKIIWEINGIMQKVGAMNIRKIVEKLSPFLKEGNEIRFRPYTDDTNINHVMIVNIKKHQEFLEAKNKGYLKDKAK